MFTGKKSDTIKEVTSKGRGVYPSDGWQNLTPAERVTWSGRLGYPPWRVTPTYRVNVIKLEREIIWTGGLPHLSGLPHLPGVPHLYVNRP